MDTKPCPACGETILATAKKCKHCGEDVRSVWRRHPIIISFVILFMIGMVAGQIESSSSSAKEESEYEKKLKVCSYAQIEIKNQLKSPTTAQFPLCEPGNIIRGEGGKYQVKSFVDAQNSFGATTRTEYSCKVELTGGKEYLIKCEIL